MNPVSRAKGSATRTANKIKRRENILSVARNMISSDGIDEFTLKKLASAAQVTVPTIHNLIGKKSQVFQQLVEDTVLRIEQTLFSMDGYDPIVAVETFVDRLMKLYSKDPDFYKAAYVAGEHIKLFEHELPTGIFSKSLDLAIKVCKDAQVHGYLNGHIDAISLAHQLFACQRLARQDWVNGYIDLKAYRVQILLGMYIVLAADATTELHARLLEKIQHLSQNRCHC